MKSLLDLHTHTVESGHAYSTLKENIEQASLAGLKVLGTSDHAPAMPHTTNENFFANLKVLRPELMGVRILRGVELNITDYSGTVDLPEKILAGLDFAIASLHPPTIPFGTPEDHTNAVIGAMENPYVNVIGHPDDSRFPLQYDRLVRAAGANHVALELNNSSLSPNSYRKNARENAAQMLELCREYGVMVIVNSDSHIYHDIGFQDYALALLEELRFPQELVVNFDLDRLWALLAAKPRG